jgi:hypothetical protein
VEKELNKQGYVLLEKYTGSHTKTRMQCPLGHEIAMTWSNFSSGHRCAVCANRVVTHQQVKEAFESAGYVLLSQKYENNRCALDYVCSQGHRCQTQWKIFSKGYRCPVCAGQVVTHEQVDTAFRDSGYLLLSQYCNSKDALMVRCPAGHSYRTSWDNFRCGHRCGLCATGGFKSDIPATLYYIRFNSSLHDSPLYKIGITNRQVEERFAQEPTPYTVLSEHRYLFGFLAQEEEQLILKKYERYSYSGRNILVSGNTELFTRDVLGLDRRPYK